MNYNIGFIGYGKMAKAIAKYLSNNEQLMLSASDKYETSFTDIANYTTNAELVKNNDIIFLSVKPQNAMEALMDIDFANKIVVSIMAGTTIDTIKEIAKNSTKIVRVMPNLCASIGKSTNAYSSIGLSSNESELISSLLNSFGSSYPICENQFDAVTGLTGSSPAYIFRFAKNIIECGAEQGFTYNQSLEMVTNTIIGCAEVLCCEKSIEEIESLIENVCSKGGTTIEGIYKLDEGNFDSIVKSSIEAAISRSKELSGK